MRDDLPARADALLAHQPRSQEAPFYTESTFRYKLRRDLQRVFGRAFVQPCPLTSRFLRLEWREVMDRVQLTEREADVLTRVFDGVPPDEIAVARQVSRQTIHQAFRRGIEKIREARDVYPYADLAEVYRSELRRGRRNRSIR